MLFRKVPLTTGLNKRNDKILTTLHKSESLFEFELTKPY